MKPPEEMMPVERVAALAAEQGCAGYHSVDGSEEVGPTWPGPFGSKRWMEDGSSMMADEAYLRQLILNLAVHVIEGCPNEVLAPGPPLRRGGPS